MKNNALTTVTITQQPTFKGIIVIIKIKVCIYKKRESK